ncbi:MAG TPA: alpha/beta fold hydrolase [Stellaceae bacterium]|nr:alpha/beta fold hydrolase [Stellaceae bacterium]
MRRLMCIAFLVAVSAGSVRADGIVREMTSLAVTLPSGGQAKLEAMIVRPDRPGRFPLVVMVHGTPRDAGKRRSMSPAPYIGPAEFFATRGYAVVAIMRRGFGHSDGPYAEVITGPCNDRDYLRAATTSADDVLGTVAALRGEPWVDPSRIVLLGQSTGGLAVSAAAATNPSGVIGILNFAGGRGSDAPDHVCSEDRLVSDFGVLGQSARIPALWLYSENDHFFSPDLAHRMFEAYRRAGAPAQLVMLPPIGTDGHFALTIAPSEVVWPPVETFLTLLHLPVDKVMELPPMALLAQPPGLTAACVAGFGNYVAARTDAKAFAINPEGHCGWIFSASSPDEAKRVAMSECAKRGANCALYAVGQSLAAQ